MVSTPTGVHRLNAYALRISIPEIALEGELPAVPVVDLAGARVLHDDREQQIIALIGRDVLTRCILTYDGPRASFTISSEDA